MLVVLESDMEFGRNVTQIGFHKKNIYPKSAIIAANSLLQQNSMNSVFIHKLS